MSSDLFRINPRRRNVRGLSKAGLERERRAEIKLRKKRAEKRRVREYAKRKGILSGIMDFKFGARVKLTSGQRGTITRAWKKYGYTAKKVKDGEFVFTKQPDKIRRHFRNSKYDRQIGGKVYTYDSIFHTNKGIIVHEEGRIVGSVRYEGRGKNVRQIVDIPGVRTKGGRILGREETFIRRPAGESISHFAARIFEEYGPEQIALAVNGYMGKELFSYDAWLNYQEKIITDMEVEDSTEFFTGLFITTIIF